MKIISTLIITTLLIFSLNTQAAEITSSSAEYKNNRFIIKVVGVVSSSQESIFALLTDYANLTKTSPKLIESKIIRQDGDATIVKNIARGCVWFFCKDIINTQRATTIPIKHIQATTIPAGSNLKFGKMVWDIKKVESGTEISYCAEIEPDFFVPPLIGTYFIKNAMLKEAKTFIDSVEKLTSANPVQ
jgi:hypothetical protein